jgi:hypothetical protein
MNFSQASPPGAESTTRCRRPPVSAVNRHFAARKVDPQAAIADNHLNALADQLPRHTVTVAVVAPGFGAGARFAASARGQIDRPIQNCRLAMAGGARGWLSFPNAPYGYAKYPLVHWSARPFARYRVIQTCRL